MLAANARHIMLRGKKLEIQLKQEFYTKQGIELADPPSILIWEFLRGLLDHHQNDFLATDIELSRRVPKGLPKFMTLEEWNHPDLANGMQPGTHPTFMMLAKAMETGDATKYEPTESSNTHWHFWPEGGAL
jgi:hypothetical protein